jgi:hypothetical protein
MLADRLRNSSKEERKNILATMYSELFERVPDHSRLTRRVSESETLAYNQSKFALIKRFLKKIQRLWRSGPAIANLPTRARSLFLK